MKNLSILIALLMSTMASANGDLRWSFDDDGNTQLCSTDAKHLMSQLSALSTNSIDHISFTARFAGDDEISSFHITTCETNADALLPAKNINIDVNIDVINDSIYFTISKPSGKTFELFCTLVNQTV